MADSGGAVGVILASIPHRGTGAAQFADPLPCLMLASVSTGGSSPRGHTPDDQLSDRAREGDLCAHPSESSLYALVMINSFPLSHHRSRSRCMAGSQSTLRSNVNNTAE